MPTIFTVLFDGRFWVGVLERHDADRVRAARVVFGAEPSDVELHAWLLAHGSELLERVERAPRVRETRAGRPRRSPSTWRPWGRRGRWSPGCPPSRRA